MAMIDLLRESAHAAFRFVVEIGGASQAAFTECTLPVLELEVEEIKEGGLNTFTHLLPGRRKSARITLKNGVGKSELLAWYIGMVAGEPTRRDLTVKLLDATKQTVMNWHIKDACPVKWTGPQLKSADDTIAIQSLEFACGEIAVSIE